MERKHENNPVNNPSTTNPAQNELDLGFNQIEPIAPKKIIKSEPSIFDRAKNVFARKDNNDNIQFAVRKEPTFGQPTYNNISSNINVSANINIPSASASVSEEKNVQNESSMPKVAATGFTDAMKNAARNVSTKETVIEPIEPIVVEPIKESAEQIMNEEMANMDNTVVSKKVDEAETLTVTLEPTENVAETAIETESESVESPVVQEPIAQQIEQPSEETNEKTIEPIVATRPQIKNPENWGVLQKLPLKHRRLFIAILGFVVLLSLFFWLKPDPTPTVEDFQVQNNNALPIEFQPLEPKQNENQVSLSENIEDHSASMSRESSNPTDVAFSAESIGLARAAVALPVAKAEQPTPTEDVKKTDAKATDSANAVTTPTDKNQVADKTPMTNKSQADKSQTVDRSKPAEKTTEPRAVQTTKAQTPKAEKQRPPVVEAKPTTQSMGAGNAKTLVVPQGVSLMQVFRNHNLNIADVNAMTKAPGAGNTLSSFNPGDKVQILVNDQGRVTQLRLSNGATFVRQANGTYKYHK